MVFKGDDLLYLLLRCYAGHMICSRNNIGQSQHRNDAAWTPWHKLHKRENFLSQKKKSTLKPGEKGNMGHLVSIKKIKWFTQSLFQAALLLGGVHAALSIIIQLT